MGIEWIPTTWSQPHEPGLMITEEKLISHDQKGTSGSTAYTYNVWCWCFKAGACIQHIYLGEGMWCFLQLAQYTTRAVYCTIE